MGLLVSIKARFRQRYWERTTIILERKLWEQDAKRMLHCWAIIKITSESRRSCFVVRASIVVPKWPFQQSTWRTGHLYFAPSVFWAISCNLFPGLLHSTWKLSNPLTSPLSKTKILSQFLMIFNRWAIVITVKSLTFSRTTFQIVRSVSGSTYVCSDFLLMQQHASQVD